LQLAHFARAGDLTPTLIPEEPDEAIRDLSRAREEALRARMGARHQLKALLLRHGVRYTGKCSWTKARERFLAQLSFPHPAQNIAFVEYRTAVKEADERLERITAALRDQVDQWRLRPVVAALVTLRGIEMIAAVTLIAELGDLKRFEHPKRLMSFLGLVPSEYSSRQSRSLGGITKAGNTHARRGAERDQVGAGDRGYRDADVLGILFALLSGDHNFFGACRPARATVPNYGSTWVVFEQNRLMNRRQAINSDGCGSLAESLRHIHRTNRHHPWY
jgi:hypothetical protein